MRTQHLLRSARHAVASRRDVFKVILLERERVLLVSLLQGHKVVVGAFVRVALVVLAEDVVHHLRCNRADLLLSLQVYGLLRVVEGHLPHLLISFTLRSVCVQGQVLELPAASSQLKLVRLAVGFVG